MGSTGLNPTAVKSIGLVGKINNSVSGHLLICLNIFAIGNGILKEGINMYRKS